MDINLIKNRLNTLQNKKGGQNKEERAKNFWKPSVGKQIIRHLQEFFNKSKKNKTIRNKKSKNYKLNKTQRRY